MTDLIDFAESFNIDYNGFENSLLNFVDFVGSAVFDAIGLGGLFDFLFNLIVGLINFNIHITHGLTNTVLSPLVYMILHFAFNILGL